MLFLFKVLEEVSSLLQILEISTADDFLVNVLYLVLVSMLWLTVKGWYARIRNEARKSVLSNLGCITFPDNLWICPSPLQSLDTFFVKLVSLLLTGFVGSQISEPVFVSIILPCIYQSSSQPALESEPFFEFFGAFTGRTQNPLWPCELDKSTTRPHFPKIHGKLFLTWIELHNVRLFLHNLTLLTIGWICSRPNSAGKFATSNVWTPRCLLEVLQLQSLSRWPTQFQPCPLRLWSLVSRMPYPEHKPNSTVCSLILWGSVDAYLCFNQLFSCPESRLLAHPPCSAHSQMLVKMSACRCSSSSRSLMFQPLPE